jgi:hypothetical protein
MPWEPALGGKLPPETVRYSGGMTCIREYRAEDHLEPGLTRVQGTQPEALPESGALLQGGSKVRPSSRRSKEQA